MVYVACNDKRESLTARARWRNIRCRDLQLLHQPAVPGEVALVTEPAHKLSRLLRANAVDVGKDILRFRLLRGKEVQLGSGCRRSGGALVRYSHGYQFVQRVGAEQAAADVESAEWYVECIEQSVSLYLSALVDGAHDVGSRLLAEALHECQLADVTPQFIDVSIFRYPAQVDEFGKRLFGDAVNVHALF